MIKLKFGLAAYLAATSAQPAIAAHITQSSFPSAIDDLPTSIDGFDSALGTLTSVFVTAQWRYMNTTNAPIAFPETVWNPTVTFSSVARNPDQVGSLQIVGDGFIDPITSMSGLAHIFAHASKQTLFETPSDLQFFTSNAKIFDIGSFYTGPGAFTQLAESGSSIKVTYNFTPASTVPEPGTWLMLALGIGIAGSAARGWPRLQRPRSNRTLTVSGAIPLWARMKNRFHDETQYDDNRTKYCFHRVVHLSF